MGNKIYSMMDTPERRLEIELLNSDNANLLLQNAIQATSIRSLQDENAELMLRIAMLEMQEVK